MILTEFLKGRDVKINAVSNYISRNPEKFEGHIRREGKNTILDEDAIRILEEKYPLAKPVVIINGLNPDEERELRTELADALKKLAWSENKRAEAEKILGKQEGLIESHEAKMLALKSEKDAEISALENGKRIAEEEIARLKAEKDAEKQRLEAELEAERRKTWFQKLLKK